MLDQNIFGRADGVGNRWKIKYIEVPQKKQKLDFDGETRRDGESRETGEIREMGRL